jgi:hypothetical protein
MRVKKIFKLQIALQLLSSKKHNLLYTESNRNKDGFTVFCFEESEELLKDLTEITCPNR